MRVSRMLLGGAVLAACLVANGLGAEAPPKDLNPVKFKPAPATAAVALVVLLSAVSARAQIAVRGETVHTMAGASIRDGVVLVRGGKIERVGPASEVKIPNGYRVINARVVTPGLVDAHTVVGLSGYLNQPHDQMQLERSSPMQPELRATDAYDARERLIEWLRTLGVTNTVSEKALRDAGAEVVTRSLADWTPDAVHHLFD